MGIGRTAPLNWTGVYPALTTAFAPGGEVDLDAVAAHADRLTAAGCAGLVALGSLGEGAALSFEEKGAVLRAVCRGAAGRVPVVAGVGALSTEEAERIARAAADTGCAGLMVLPPLAYAGDGREACAHAGAVLRATDLPAMLYNNPAAYRTDFLPDQILALAADHPNLVAVKESSGDVRRLTALAAGAAGRLALLVGLDDAVVEGVLAGADGWVAGLVNAFPAQSVELLRLARALRNGDGVPVPAPGKAGTGAGPAFAARAPSPPALRARTESLYRWFLPLLRFDGLPKFVQHIKLAQHIAGFGDERVRPPRLPLAGDERAAAVVVIEAAMRTLPADIP